MSHRAAILSALLLLLSPMLAQRLPSFRIKEEESRDHFRRGLTFYNSGQYLAAREFFYKALNRVPSFHLARRYLGDANYYSGEWNSALEQWEFLDKRSEGTYSLIRMRSDLLRFRLNGFRDAGPYIHFRTFNKKDFGDISALRPVDIAVDSEANVYYLFSESANIIVSNAGATSFRQIRGSIFDRMKGPSAMALLRDRIYVADYSDDRIRIFDRSGSSISSFGTTGSEKGQLRGPAGIAVTADAVYVSDSGNRRIEKFDLDGKHILSFLTADTGLKFPAGIAVDGENVYVADRDSARIFTFDRDGNQLDQIESKMLSHPRGVSVGAGKLVIADEEAGVLFYDLAEKTWTRLETRTEDDRTLVWKRAYSARMDSNGVLMAADTGAGLVHMFMPEALRISNLECRVERVDTASFPDVAVFLQLRNRLGNPLPGLDRNEIRIFENDRFLRGINTSSMEDYQNRVNLSFVKENNADLSSEENKNVLSTILTSFLAPIRISDRIKVIRAGESVRSVYEGLQRRMIIRSMQEGETTERPDVGKALVEAIGGQITSLGPRAVIAIVSGASANPFVQYPVDRVEYFARAQGIPIYIISFEEGGPGDTQDTYRALATNTGGAYIRAYDETSVRALYESIRARKDERYIITYHSGLTPDLADRYVDVRIDVDHQGMTGSAEGGYFVPRL
ncbi:MAG TPA: NHL repeat-containing protein [Leptospiraceae bacterium]|nr:NHL repeat-containing protein [Leptospiraceae bacterium]